jgi:tellurite resistance protein TerC
MSMSLTGWIGFVVVVLALLALDLGVFHRKSKVPSVGEALGWTAFWVSLALAFNVAVYFLYRESAAGASQAALQFLTGYIIEKSLSLDNVFVIALIFVHLRIPLEQQHRVLYWGILGALVLRGVMIAAGAYLIQRFSWVVYVFGVLLLVTAVKLLVDRHDNLQLEQSPVVRLARRLFPLSDELHGSRFFVRIEGVWTMTPLFLALLVVEASDVVFAVDSIPAIFAVTRDPFLVFTSNVFAILGLRSLYFALASVMESFRYLKMSLVYILAFVGVKMLLSHHYPIPTPISLAVIVGVLAVGIVASIVGRDRDTAKLVSPLRTERDALLALTWKRARPIVVLVAGSTLLLVGALLLVLPGPGLLLVALGLAVLGTEFLWARRFLERARVYIGSLPKKDGTS